MSAITSAELHNGPGLGAKAKLMRPLVYSFAIFSSVVAYGNWKPPENPNPDKIITEAQGDTCAGRYEDSLAKHVWFHQNALKYDPALYGVRLSFALMDWVTLGSAYPPALQKLEAIRDQDAKDIREGKGSHDAFHDFKAINDYLKEDGKTQELFLWLDSNNPRLAKEVYELAQPVLIRAKAYSLCGKYIDPVPMFQQILRNYRETSQSAPHSTNPEFRRDFAEKYFSNRTATLVALLVVNNRKAEADRVVTQAEKEWSDSKFKSLLEKAETGDVPAPWP